MTIDHTGIEHETHHAKSEIAALFGDGFFVTRANSTLASPGIPLAIINMSGDISSDTTWTNGNIYVVMGDVTVLPGVTLTLEPGTIVNSQKDRRLIIDGKLVGICYCHHGSSSFNNNDESVVNPPRGEPTGLRSYAD